MVNMSISMPGEQFGKVSVFQSENDVSSFSQAASRLIKLGLIYSHILEMEEQE